MRVFVQSFGCSTNLADGEVLAGCLRQAGYELANSLVDAEIAVYNTCAVKGPTENRMIEILKRVPRNKKLVVAGCLPLINYERLSQEVAFDAVVGAAVGEKIVEVVNQVLDGKKIIALQDADKMKPSLNLPAKWRNPVVSIIPVNYGCLGSCAYCCVRHARGKLRSFTVDEVVDRFTKDLMLDAHEFWITSQDTACYGRDLGVNLADLLTALGGIEGEFMIRVGMMTPNVALDILGDLVEAFNSEHIFKFIHLPVQSGSDAVLKKMQRAYTIDDFKKIVEVFRTAYPQMTLATDVICGFPGESNQDFQQTLTMLKETEPDIVNVSKFFARPRTAASKMQEEFVSLEEIRRRSKAAVTLAHEVSLEKNQQWIEWTGTICVDEIGKISDTWVGRNFAYKPIAFRSSHQMLGKRVGVRVVKALSTHLQGQLVE